MIMFKNICTPTVVSIMTASLLSGCAIPRYQPPAGIPTANLRIVSSKSENNTISIGERSECLSSKTSPVGIVGANANSLVSNGGGVSIGMPSPSSVPSKQTTEFTIDATKSISVHGSLVSITGFLPTPPFFLYTFCNTGVSFLPKPRENYEVVFNQSAPSSCTAEVSILKKNADNIWVRDSVQGATALTSSCK